jgi:hypothetical protein
VAALELGLMPETAELPPLFIGKDYVRVTGNRISVYSRGRGADIILGAVMIVLGLYIVITGDLVQVGAEGSVTSSWSSLSWAIILVALGALRWGALIINGRRRQGWTALVRSVTAAASALFWTGITTFLLSEGQGLDAILFCIPMCSEVYCSLRAAKESALIRRAKKITMMRVADAGAT